MLEFFNYNIKMEISMLSGLLILGAALLLLFIFGGCKTGCGKKDHFTRTCLNADVHCNFVRSPVDFAYPADKSEIPAHQGMLFPHWLANISDKIQPLEGGPIDLIRDEQLLQDQDLLWKQYGNEWKGCGDGKRYIVNDDRTRSGLTDIGDLQEVRELNHMRVPRALWGPEGREPALTDFDIIRPEPFPATYVGGQGHR